MNAKTKRIVIEPVTRVEGHGKVTILLDAVRELVHNGLDLLGVGAPEKM